MSKNQTERSLEEKSKKPRYLYHFPLIVGGCIATSMIISAINPDSSPWGIVFVELPYLFIALLLISFIRKAIVPMILSYVIIFAIPVFFVLNNKQIIMINTNSNQVLYKDTGIIVIRKNKCDSNLMHKLVPEVPKILAYFDFKLWCEYLKWQFPISIKDKKTKYYASRSFYRKYSNIANGNKFNVFYNIQKIPLSGFYFASLFTKSYSEERVVYKMQGGSFVLDSFINTYKREKNMYLLFSFLLFLNSLLFTVITRNLYKNKLSF